LFLIAGDPHSFSAMTGEARARFRVTGVVQGVGFRPFVYRLAHELGLSGYVLNDARGVLIEAEGPSDTLLALPSVLRGEAPPLAVIDDIAVERMEPLGDSGFEIRASGTGGVPLATVPPDSATCTECLAEMSNPSDRRYGYAFINCTDCGPRFTIVTTVPYDRPNTTMAAFEMCEACRDEYEDQASRRFHAQPIACPQCGPVLRLDDRAPEHEPVDEAARLLRDGCVVAVKGLGGYHLACDASDLDAVTRLRARKHREEKPLAVMVADLNAARGLVELSDEEAEILASPRAPIVLLRRRRDAAIAEAVAPGNPYLGLMLPYTPLHHLLMSRIQQPLVLTSGNLTDEPVTYEDANAKERLGAIADAFLTHDRKIQTRCDDSVVRVVRGREYPVRRSRGYAPEPIAVSRAFVAPVLAAGPELKHTFCFGIEGAAVLSHHIGDLQTYEAMTAFTDGIEHFQRLFEMIPEFVAHDLHPEYLSTKWALDSTIPTKVPVQHHHAHIASCLADNHRYERVIGLALDGTGMGDDGTLWGCEVLIADHCRYERVAHLSYINLPGGEAAIKEPWRVGAVYLDAAFGDAADDLNLPFVRETAAAWAPVLKMAAQGLNAPRASSAGRLFDAASAICGIRSRASFEGQAAAELENIADPSTRLAYPCALTDGVLDGVGLIRGLAEDLAGGRSVPEAAGAFHNGFAAALVEACESIAELTGLRVVALSGGTWQNLLLLERVMAGLEQRGIEVLIHRRVPCNDGGLSLGQAVVANAVANEEVARPAGDAR